MQPPDDLRERFMADAADTRPDVHAHLDAVLGRHRRSRRTSGISLLAAAALVVLVVLAVRLTPQSLLSGPSGPGRDGVHPSPSADVAASLVGRYAATLPADPEVAALGAAGRWDLELREDGTMLVTPPVTFPGGGAPLSGGIWKLGPEGFRTNLFSEVAPCSPVGTFTVERSSGGILFTAPSSECPMRRIVLASEAWQPAR